MRQAWCAGHAVRHLQAGHADRRYSRGHRSLASRLELLDDDATLTDERIAACTAEAVARAKLRTAQAACLKRATDTTMHARRHFLRPTDTSPPMDRVILPSLETPTLTKAELAELLFERSG
jgi:hypothetical protein